MPHELWSALSVLVPDADEVYGRPEHTTRVDKFSRARQHDLFACLRRDGVMTTAIVIEAKVRFSDARSSMRTPAKYSMPI